ASSAGPMSRPRASTPALMESLERLKISMPKTITQRSPNMRQAPRQAEAMLSQPVSDRRDHIRGNPTATVTLVEYGDFECPHCGRAHPILTELLDRIGNQIRFVFRHFPLSQMHPHAQMAAEASEAAAAQQKFW